MRLRASTLIVSQWQGTLGGRTGDSVNPASGQETGTFAASGKADAQQAIAASAPLHAAASAASSKKRCCNSAGTALAGTGLDAK
jgi:acyl-CoA reductase-like NAD-dependent aldehyde dehydrogenase